LIRRFEIILWPSLELNMVGGMGREEAHIGALQNFGNRA
jgi:hypothetical protein